MAPRLVVSALVHGGLVVLVLLLADRLPKDSAQPPPSFELMLQPGKPPTGPDVTSQPGSNPTPPAPPEPAPSTAAPPESRIAPSEAAAPSAAPPPPLPPAAAPPSAAPPSAAPPASVPPQAVASAAAPPASAAPSLSAASPALLPPALPPAAPPPPVAPPQAVASAAIPPPAIAPPTPAAPSEAPPSAAPQMIFAPAIPTPPPPPPAAKDVPAVRVALALPDEDTAMPDLEPPPPMPARPPPAPPPPTPPPRRQGATAQRMEITLGEPLTGSINLGGSMDSADDMIHVHGADIGEDWKRALHQWWEEHATYPTEALRRQHEGKVKIHLRIDHAGHVKLVGLESSSGSQWLDAGAQAVFRGETVPPLPASTTEATKDLDLTIDYVLIRR